MVATSRRPSPVHPIEAASDEVRSPLISNSRPSASWKTVTIVCGVVLLSAAVYWTSLDDNHTTVPAALIRAAKRFASKLPFVGSLGIAAHFICPTDSRLGNEGNFRVYTYDGAVHTYSRSVLSTEILYRWNSEGSVAEETQLHIGKCQQKFFPAILQQPGSNVITAHLRMQMCRDSSYGEHGIVAQSFDISSRGTKAQADMVSPSAIITSNDDASWLPLNNPFIMPEDPRSFFVNGVLYVLHNNNINGGRDQFIYNNATRNACRMSMAPGDPLTLGIIEKNWSPLVKPTRICGANPQQPGDCTVTDELYMVYTVDPLWVLKCDPNSCKCATVFRDTSANTRAVNTHSLCLRGSSSFIPLDPGVSDSMYLAFSHSNLLFTEDAPLYRTQAIVISTDPWRIVAITDDNLLDKAVIMEMVRPLKMGPSASVSGMIDFGDSSIPWLTMISSVTRSDAIGGDELLIGSYINDSQAFMAKLSGLLRVIRTSLATLEKSQGTTGAAATGGGSATVGAVSSSTTGGKARQQSFPAGSLDLMVRTRLQHLLEACSPVYPTS
jgi:hypothetical protein